MARTKRHIQKAKIAKAKREGESTEGIGFSKRSHDKGSYLVGCRCRTCLNRSPKRKAALKRVVRSTRQNVRQGLRNGSDIPEKVSYRYL